MTASKFGPDDQIGSLYFNCNKAADFAMTDGLKIYIPMQGPSELGLSGKLLDWDRTNDLPKITPPTLVIGAKYDTMDPAHMEMRAEKVQRGRYLFCPNGSHLAMYDDQKVYVEGVIQFILDVNSGKF